MMRLKYIGSENGILILGRHFTKDEVVEVEQHEYNEILKTHKFEFDTSVNGGRPSVPKIEKVITNDKEEDKSQEIKGDMDGDGDVDLKDIVQVIKNVGKRTAKPKKKK